MFHGTKAVSPYLYFFWLGIILISCDRGRLDTKRFSTELKEKKIKRITPGEISSNVLKVGNTFSDTLFKLLNKGECKLESLPVVQNFVEDFGANVQIFKLRDTSRMDKITKEIVLSTEFGIVNHIEEASKANIQYLQNEYWLYTIPLNNGMCNDSEFSILCLVISQPEIIKKIN